MEDRVERRMQLAPGIVMFRPGLGLKAPALAWLSAALACIFVKPGQPLPALAWPGLALAQAGLLCVRCNTALNVPDNG